MLGSLVGAKQAFLFALAGLLNTHFDSPIQTTHYSPTLDRAGPPTIQHTAATPTTSHSPFTDSSAAFSAPTTADLLPSDPDFLLPQLIERLRQHTASSSLRAAGGRQFLVEELQARLDSFAVELPPADAELARALGALLSCIERLLNISRAQPVSGDATPARVPVAGPASGGSDVYARLERETRALQASSSKDAEWPTGLVGAAREVELAERDLLWGRVDDLSERVGQMCRRRAAAIAEDEAREQQEQLERTWESPTLPPTYDTLHHPPAYAHNHPASPTNALRSSTESSFPDSLDEKAALSQPRTSRGVSGAHGEKMQRDLESVSLAIERLYLVTPQLANQRVEPDRRLLRERQLAKLGNAIERLSKGRLDDQRAKASPTLEEDPVENRIRLRRQQDEALERLITQIDKAASRTMLDQRVDLQRVRSRSRSRIERQDNPESEKPAKVLSDPHEAERREFILSHTGKGRLQGQDAVLPVASSSAFPGPRRGSLAPVSIAEFLAGDEDGRPRRASMPGSSLPSAEVKKKFSTRSLFPSAAAQEEQQQRPPMGEKKSSLRLGAFKMPGGVRRGSYDSSLLTGLGVLGTGMSRSASATERELQNPSPVSVRNR